MATFSIVAADLAAGELGVAVASRFYAAGLGGAVGPRGTGAVVAQSTCNTPFGPRGLDLLERGASPEKALRILLKSDAEPDRRRMGIVGADGSSITYTGKGCNSWAGGRHGPNYAVQGNILT